MNAIEDALVSFCFSCFSTFCNSVMASLLYQQAVNAYAASERKLPLLLPNHRIKTVYSLHKARLYAALRRIFPS